MQKQMGIELSLLYPESDKRISEQLWIISENCG